MSFDTYYWILYSKKALALFQFTIVPRFSCIGCAKKTRFSPEGILKISEKDLFRISIR